MVKTSKTKSPGSGFACMECGYKFRTIASAERAAFGPNGCPKCGGADIDLASTFADYGVKPSKPANS
jgi:hypothetical protein